MSAAAKLLEGPQSQRWLTIGLLVLAVILIVQGGINGIVVRRAESRALGTYRDSLVSIQYLTQIDRDMGEERILVDDHIFEQKTVNMQLIEAQLSDLDRDIQRTSKLYDRVTELPNEAKLWQRVQMLWSRFDEVKAEALAFSRQLDDVHARAAMEDVFDDYRELDDTLAQLHTINRNGAQQAVDEITAVQSQSQNLMWAMRGIALVVIVFLGLWGRRRIAMYEQQILEDTRLLEERNHDLDAFSGRVAHDLKNALAPMAMTPELLRRRPDDAGRVLEIAGRIERSLRREVGIVDALLAFSRGSRSVAANESAALVPVLENVLEELSASITQLDVSVELGAIPDVRLRCDAELLHVVLANLCGNAIKFLAGRAERRVRISAQEEDAACRIEVEDTGPGIPQAARERIFEPFYRVAGTQAPGSGIGLATVHRVVRARGGRVAVESTDGQGSRFKLWLPLMH